MICVCLASDNANYKKMTMNNSTFLKEVDMLNFLGNFFIEHYAKSRIFLHLVNVLISDWKVYENGNNDRVIIYKILINFGNSKTS